MGVAVINHPGHSAHRLFERSGHIVTVAKKDVDVVKLETLERRLGALDDVLARVAALVRITLSSTEEDPVKGGIRRRTRGRKGRKR